MFNRVLTMALSVTYKRPEPKVTLTVRSRWIRTYYVRKTNILAGRNVDISKSENNCFRLKPRRIRKSLVFHLIMLRKSPRTFLACGIINITEPYIMKFMSDGTIFCFLLNVIILHFYLRFSQYVTFSHFSIHSHRITHKMIKKNLFTGCRYIELGCFFNQLLVFLHFNKNP